MVDLSVLAQFNYFLNNLQPLACFISEGPFFFLLRLFGWTLPLGIKIIFLALQPTIVLIALFILDILIFSRFGPMVSLVGGLFLSNLYGIIVFLVFIMTLIEGASTIYCNYNEIAGFFSLK